jgi:hypothetical protein
VVYGLGMFARVGSSYLANVMQDYVFPSVFNITGVTEKIKAAEKAK